MIECKKRRKFSVCPAEKEDGGKLRWERGIFIGLLIFK